MIALPPIPTRTYTAFPNPTLFRAHAGGRAARRAAGGHIAARIGFVEILLEMQPQYIERIGAVVGIGDAHGAADRLGLGIERRTDRVIGTVLPIIRAGHPVRRSIAVDRLAKIERCEGDRKSTRLNSSH